MALPEDTFREISQITSDLIGIGLCIDQNFPVLRDRPEAVREVGFGASEALSQTLRNVPYATAYEALKATRSYNISFIDGGLLHLLYRFTNNELSHHRLAFFPSPNLLEFQNNAEIYEMDEMYSDVVERNVVTTPIRFDFDRNAFVEIDHPMSHLTIGQYRNCRIPVSGPLTPYAFVNFVLRAFYNTTFRRYSGEIREHKYDHARTITAAEARDLHIQVRAIA